MATVRNRYDPVRLFLRRVGTLALFFLVVAAISAVWNVWQKERESRELRNQAQTEQSDLTVQEEHLRTELAKLESERGREEVLRQQYDVGRRGEGLIIIVEPPSPEPLEGETGVRAWMRKFLPFW